MDRLFSTLATEDAPNVSAFRDEGENLTLSMPLPGFRDEEIELTATHDELFLSGQREGVDLEGYERRHRERGALSFSQRHPFPCRVATDRISATLRDGVLRIEIPKTGEEARRTIRIGGAN